MDQKNSRFYDPGEFDHASVDLTKSPTTAEEYMRMVVVDRERCPTVVAANIPAESLKPKKRDVPLFPDEDPRNFAATPFAPGKEWNKKKCDYFSLQRTMIEGSVAPEAETTIIKELSWAAPTEKKRWLQLCFEQRLAKFPMASKLEETMAHHQGTPPTLSLVKCLDDNLVSCLLCYQIEHLLEHGPSRAVMEWIYSLLLVVKKPLLHDVCSSLREMAKYLRQARAQLGEEETELIYQYSLFIALVSLYFGQRDLADL